MGMLVYEVAVPGFTLSAQKYTGLHLPVLAISAIPHDLGCAYQVDEAVRMAAEALDAATDDPIVRALEIDVLSARVVRLARASHYVFLSNEADV
jgi:hypothetical protein